MQTNKLRTGEQWVGRLSGSMTYLWLQKVRCKLHIAAHYDVYWSPTIFVQQWTSKARCAPLIA